MNNNKNGRIIISSGVKNVLPWEMHSALALKDAGYTIRFIPAHNVLRSADSYINNTLFEFKSPEGSTIKCIENNLQKAFRFQSRNIVIDSVRVKKLKDDSIKNYLVNRMRRIRGIRRLLFVSKAGQVIDINRLLR